MGPMRAARRFALELADSGALARTAKMRVDLYGSLALTGLGHGTDRAILLGLSGEEAATIDPATIEPKLAEIRASGTLSLLGRHPISFREVDDLLLHRDQMLPPGARTHHPNGVRFTALDAAGEMLRTGTFFSIGGGFIVADGEERGLAHAGGNAAGAALPHPFSSAAELLEIAQAAGFAIWELMLANECALRPEAEVREGILHIWSVMQGCIERGMVTEGILPGGLTVRRRAPRLAAAAAPEGISAAAEFGSAGAAGLGDDLRDGGE